MVSIILSSINNIDFNINPASSIFGGMGGNFGVSGLAMFNSIPSIDTNKPIYSNTPYYKLSIRHFYNEFEQSYGTIIQGNGLDFIFLVTPETPETRLRKLDSLSSGFLYAVSSSATTGKDKDFSQVALYLERLQQMNLKNPILVGFGIKDKQSFDAVNEFTQGAIIGSAYINALSKGEDVGETTKQKGNATILE